MHEYNIHTQEQESTALPSTSNGVFAGYTWSKEINMSTILVMNWSTSIKATHIRQHIVNIGSHECCRGHVLPSSIMINSYGLVVPPGLGLEVVRSMQWTKLGRKAAVSR
jgi:hypothetical protein